MPERRYKLLFVITHMLFIIVRLVYGQRYKRSHAITRVNRVTTQEKVLLGGVAVSYFVPNGFWLFSNRLKFAQLGLRPWMRLSGLFISLASIGFFAWVHKTLGDNWSPTLEIRNQHELIEDGPYATVRHPMYTAIYGYYIGLIPLMNNWFPGLIALLGFTALYVGRVDHEEQLMREQFGAAYEEYAQRTGRLLPRWQPRE